MERSKIAYPQLRVDAYNNDEGRKEAMAAVEACLQRYHLIAKQESPNGVAYFDHGVMSNIELLDAGIEGWCVYSLKIMPSLGNINGVVHGGAISTIFDMCSATALCPLGRPGHFDFLGGVTHTLNVSYLRGITVGMTVIIRSHVTSIGRTMASIRSTIISEDGKKVYCTCEQHKVNVPTKEEHLRVRVPWDDAFERKYTKASKPSTKL